MSTTATEDVEEIRELARSVATGRIAPFAADVDEAARFPTDSGFQAVWRVG